MPEQRDASTGAPLQMVDLIRKMRDGRDLDENEIGFIVEGAAKESIPIEQLSAWLMAAWMNGLSINETRALAIAMELEPYSESACEACNEKSDVWMCEEN